MPGSDNIIALTSEQCLRLEALRLACGRYHSGSTGTVLTEAEHFAGFLISGSVKEGVDASS